jgi:hypothetical protein
MTKLRDVDLEVPCDDVVIIIAEQDNRSVRQAGRGWAQHRNAEAVEYREDGFMQLRRQRDPQRSCRGQRQLNVVEEVALGNVR